MTVFKFGGRFRKLPVEIEACQYKGGHTSADQCIAWAIERNVTSSGHVMRWVRLGDTLDIQTWEGTMSASPGDWIICGIKGEFYPCKPDIFEDTYEPVVEGDA